MSLRASRTIEGLLVRQKVPAAYMLCGVLASPGH